MKKVIALTLSTLIAPIAFAEGEAVEAAEEVVSAKSQLQQAFDDFAQEMNINYGIRTAQGKMFSIGTARVEADVSSPAFVKSRWMAYETAYINALAQVILDAYGQDTTTKKRKLLEDFSDGAELQDAPAKTLNDKLRLLTEVQVEKALEEEGVPEEKYKAASIIDKRQMLDDSIGNNAVQSAIHAAAGCIPVKTIEACGSDGNYYIGVIVRFDDQTIAMAKSFKTKKRPAISGEGVALKDALASEDEIVNEFGVRLYFEESGSPALLSYGQFGSSFTGKNTRLAERAEDHALQQASMLADSALTVFINGSINIQDSGDVAQSISTALIKYDDGNCEEESKSELSDILKRTINLKGSDKLAGRSTVFKKIVKHPNGHKVAVAVRHWSFDTYDEVSSLGKPKPAPKAEVKPAAKREGATIRKGRTYDF